MELIGSDEAPVVARTGAPGEIHVEAAQGTLYAVPSLPNLRVTASIASLMVPDVCWAGSLGVRGDYDRDGGRAPGPGGVARYHCGWSPPRDAPRASARSGRC